MKRVIYAALALLAVVATSVAQVPYYPQTLPAGTVVGRLGNTAGPTQAIPIGSLFSAQGKQSFTVNGTEAMRLYGADGTGRMIIGDVANQVSGAASAGVTPDSTGILTLLTNTGNTPAGFAAMKVGVGTSASAGWFTNPAAGAVVGYYSTLESSSTRTSGIWGANFTAIVIPGAGNDSGASGLEIDINNSNSEHSELDDPKEKNGLGIVSGGTGRPSSAIKISNGDGGVTSGATDASFFLRGITIMRSIKGIYFSQRGYDVANSFAGGAIVDDSNSDTTLKISGGTHTHGIDFTGATFTGSPVIFPGFKLTNSQRVGIADAAGSADVSLHVAKTGATQGIISHLANSSGSAYEQFTSSTTDWATGVSGTNFVINLGKNVATAGTDLFTLSGTGVQFGASGTNAGKITLAGATSGGLSLKGPAVGGSGTLTFPAGTTDFSATGGSSQVVQQTSSGGAFTVGQLGFSNLSGSVSVPQMGSTSYAVGQIAFTVTGVNFNSANTDNAIAITLPTGFTRYRVQNLFISNANHTLVTATIGLFTSTGGGGVTIATSANSTVSATTDATNNNMQSVTLTNNNTTSFTATPIYARIGTAEGAAATADLTLVITPLP